MIHTWETFPPFKPVTNTVRYFKDFTDAERLEMAKALANATPQQFAEAAKEAARTTTWHDILIPILDGLKEGIEAALNDIARE